MTVTCIPFADYSDAREPDWDVLLHQLISNNIWFKHCYWPEPHIWGVLGLPRTQSGNSFLKQYRRGDYVLLALTSDSESDMRGHIFGICTLSSLCRPTTKIINPEIPRQRYKDWPEAIAIRELWEVEPKIRYQSFASGKLAEEVKCQRGKFFKINYAKEELAAWLYSANMERRCLSHSTAVLDHNHLWDLVASQMT